MSRILVTGGAGYIGSITAKELLDNNFDVVIVDNLEKGHKEAIDQRADFELCDLHDKIKLDQVFKKYNPDLVIDFAAYIAVGESQEEPLKYFNNNVANFVTLLETMKENGVRRLIKSSTAAVYGTPTDENDLPLLESYTDSHHPAKPEMSAGKWENKDVSGEELFKAFIAYYQKFFADRKDLSLSASEMMMSMIPGSIYGLTKILDEIIMKKYDRLSDLKYIILRYFNVAGADPSGLIGQDNENPTHIFASSIFQALGKKPKLQVFGNDYATKDGTGVRDYIHVKDLAIGHVQAVKYLLDGNDSDTFNLGTGQGYSVLEVIGAVEKASGKKIDYEFGQRRPGDVPSLYANPAKANQILKWKAQYSLDQMAETAWVWHSTHREGYKTK